MSERTLDGSLMVCTNRSNGTLACSIWNEEIVALVVEQLLYNMLERLLMTPEARIRSKALDCRNGIILLGNAYARKVELHADRDCETGLSLVQSPVPVDQDDLRPHLGLGSLVRAQKMNQRVGFAHG